MVNVYCTHVHVHAHMQTPKFIHQNLNLIVGAWLDTFGNGFFAKLSAEDKLNIKTEIVTKLEPQLSKEGRWHLDYVRLRFHAVKR